MKGGRDRVRERGRVRGEGRGLGRNKGRNERGKGEREMMVTKRGGVVRGEEGKGMWKEREGYEKINK